MNIRKIFFAMLPAVMLAAVCSSCCGDRTAEPIKVKVAVVYENPVVPGTEGKGSTNIIRPRAIPSHGTTLRSSCRNIWLQSAKLHMA